MKILIYAMPRSGSAWLANFLTHDGMVFHHDPLGRMTVTEASKLEAAVDTGAYLFPQLQAERSYQLVRRVDDCNRSLVKLGLPPIAEYQGLRGRTFYYERLFDVGYLAELWQEVRGPGFDQERAEVLIDLNVQHRLDRILGARQCLG